MVLRSTKSYSWNIAESGVKHQKSNITYIVSINYCSRSEDTDEITCFAVEVDDPDSFTAMGRKWIVQNIDKWDESTERTQNGVIVQ
jgi:hypothetical protein